jgi:excinuclease ABC subunit C
LLQRLRNEAHDTAVSFYQKRHRKDLLVSSLDDIPGVGPRRRQLLLKHLGSLQAVERAGLDELKAVPTLPDHVAHAVYDYFHGDEGFQGLED